MLIEYGVKKEAGVVLKARLLQSSDNEKCVYKVTL